MDSFIWRSGAPFLMALITISFLIYNFRPTWLISLWKRYRVSCAGVSKKHLKISNDLEISYFEKKGEKDSQILLFLHGFTGDKVIYVDIVRLLPNHFHIIVIDLPGHGESKPDHDQGDYRIDSQVENLHKFVRALSIGERKINLIGASMGGHIAGVYAAKYGDQLESVVLICPAGINSPEVTEFIKTSEKNVKNNIDSNLLLPRNTDEMKDMIKLVLYHEVKLPHRIVGALVELKNQKLATYKKETQGDMTSQRIQEILALSLPEYYQNQQSARRVKMFSDIVDPDQHFLLDKSLEDIKVPLLCVWGKHDEILHVSGTEVIKERVKHAEVHVVDRCGHAITIDRPRKLLKIMLGFLGRINT